MSDEKETALDGHVFAKFINQYRDCYGEKKMGDDSVEMWFEALCHVETKQFKLVTTSLLGNKNWPFNWMVVLERLEILYPSTVNHRALEAVWKLEDDSGNRKQQKRKFSQILACVPDLVKKNKDNWREDLFNLIYNLIGEGESYQIAKNIQMQFPEFKEWIYKKGVKK